MAENKDYNFDNFDDTKIYGKHFKDEEPTKRVFSDEFDVDETQPFTPPEQIENTDDADEYGDDFYSDASNFENEDEEGNNATQVFTPVANFDEKSYRTKTQSNNTDKKKNAIIVALVITLAVVIFVFSLIFFLSSGNDGDKKETRKPTISASETIVETETVAPTEALTEAPTQAPTEALTEALTQAPTEAFTEAPAPEPVTEFIPEETTLIVEDTFE